MTAIAKEIYEPEPEGCECDQVQRLRAERDSARESLERAESEVRQLQRRLERAESERDHAQAWSNKHQGLAEHATNVVEVLHERLMRTEAERDDLRQKIAEARDHASEARRAGINDDAQSAATHAADAVRVLTLVHDTGEAKPAEPDIHAGGFVHRHIRKR